jgi:hypothetical protein
MPLAAVNIAKRMIRQWASLGVRTKNNKTATTYLLELPDLIGVAEEWDSYVRARLPVSAIWFTLIVSELAAGGFHPGPRAGTGASPSRSGCVGCSTPRGLNTSHRQVQARFGRIQPAPLQDDTRITDSTNAPLTGDEVESL